MFKWLFHFRDMVPCGRVAAAHMLCVLSISLVKQLSAVWQVFLSKSSLKPIIHMHTSLTTLHTHTSSQCLMMHIRPLHGLPRLLFFASRSACIQVMPAVSNSFNKHCSPPPSDSWPPPPPCLLRSPSQCNSHMLANVHAQGVAKPFPSSLLQDGSNWVVLYTP